MVLCRMSVCLWGHMGLSNNEATLLSSAEMTQLRSKHACIQREGCRDGKLVPELVVRSAAVCGVVAEVAATSSEHRRAAAKRAVGEYRGVYRKSGETKWWAQICVTKDGKRIFRKPGPFGTKEQAAQTFDGVALYVHRGCDHLLDRLVYIVVHTLARALGDALLSVLQCEP